MSGAVPAADGSGDGPAAPAPHVLIVDDDARIRDLLRRFLMRHGIMVSVAADAAAARQLMAGLAFDLVVLDVMLPGEDGISLTRALRAYSRTPILLLTARGEASDRIAGLEAGADDYLAKPFEPRELLLRINAILRRAPETAPEAPPAMLRMGALRYDPARGELWDGTERVGLTGTESALMRIFARQPGIAVERGRLA